MLTKNEKIAWFDIETTGLDFDTDKIISIAIVTTDQKGNVINYFESKIDPCGVKSTKDAFEKHGITDEELVGMPKFKDVAPMIVAFMEGCDIGCHNGIKFDIPFLMREMDNAGVYFGVEKRRIIDTLSVYRVVHRKTLGDIYKEYYGSEPDQLHDAYCDVSTTIDIYKAMLDKDSLTNEVVDSACRNAVRIDMDGLFVFNPKMEIEIGKGKHRGKLVKDVDADYLLWVAQKSNMSMETRNLAMRCYKYLTNNNKKY